MIESDLIKIEAIQIAEAFNIKKIRTEFEVETYSSSISELFMLSKVKISTSTFLIMGNCFCKLYVLLCIFIDKRKKIGLRKF